MHDLIRDSLAGAVGGARGFEHLAEMFVRGGAVEFKAEQRAADPLAGVGVVEVAEVGVRADGPQELGQRAGALVEFECDEIREAQQLGLVVDQVKGDVGLSGDLLVLESTGRPYPLPVSRGYKHFSDQS